MVRTAYAVHQAVKALRLYGSIVRASGDETSRLIGYLDKAFEGDKADVVGCLASMFLRDPMKDQLLTKNVRKSH